MPIKVNEITVASDVEKLATNYDAVHDLPTVQADNANLFLENASPIDIPHLEQNLMSLPELTPEKVVQTYFRRYIRHYKLQLTSQMPWASYIRKLSISIVHFHQ